jgi:hypothetical protein
MAVVRTGVSEERISSIIREERISELGTTLAVNYIYKPHCVTSQRTAFFIITAAETSNLTGRRIMPQNAVIALYLM